jgi:hypothetical protein
VGVNWCGTLQGALHEGNSEGEAARTNLRIFVRVLLQTMRLLLRADPSLDPEAYGELSYLASRGKYRDRFEESKS